MKKTIFIAAFMLMLLGASTVFAASSGYQDASLPLYREAYEKMVTGDLAGAVASFEALLAAFPESRRADTAAYYIGYCHEKLGDLPEAFKEYLDVITTYQGSLAARKAERSAVNLARRLRTSDGDRYDQFLESLVAKRNAGMRRSAAIRMAEFGDWRGVDTLIEALREGSVFEQVRSAELLARRADIAEVSAALRQALKENRYSTVRVNALRGLYRHIENDAIRSAFIDVLGNDSSELLRSTAVRALRRYIDGDPKVRAAFDHSILHETHPMVLQPIVSIALQSKESEEMRKKMVERLRAEKDPMVQFMLSGALGAELKQVEHVSVLENLVDNPEPMVRINALRTLQPRTEDPEVRLMFVDKLKNDPDSHVRIIALNALKGEAAEDGEVREAVFTILHESNDASLVISSINAVQPQVKLPEVRNELVAVVNRAEQPVVAGQAVYALLPELERPEVWSVVVERLRQPNPVSVKYAVTTALVSAPAENHEALVAELKPLFLEEQNVSLALNYLRAIQRFDPKAAAELRKQRKISGFTFEVEVEMKKDRKKR